MQIKCIQFYSSYCENHKGKNNNNTTAIILTLGENIYLFIYFNVFIFKNLGWGKITVIITNTWSKKEDRIIAWLKGAMATMKAKATPLPPAMASDMN